MNVLSLATLATRGWRGGYLGWALPETVKRSFLRGATTTHRFSRPDVPATGVAVDIAAKGARLTRSTDHRGLVAVNLVSDLGLDSLSSDRAVLIEYRIAHHVRGLSQAYLPSEFLYSYYAFGVTPVFPDRDRKRSPLRHTDVRRSYRILERDASSVFKIELADGVRGYVKSMARFVGFATAGAAPFAATAAQPELHIDSIDGR